jgi:hypothetical protein
MMMRRKCLGCGGDLVMAFRPSERGSGSPGAGIVARPNAKWRCSTCGNSYTAEQLRADNRIGQVRNVAEHT